MSESIVHGRLMVEDLSYSMIQILNRCRFELDCAIGPGREAGSNHVIV